MKLLLILAALVGTTSNAQAANCESHFGSKASVTASGNKLYIQFSSGPYRSAVLSASGASSSSYYFRDLGNTTTVAIVNKAVLSGGAGKVYYSYRRGGHNGGGTKNVTLTCN